MNCIPHARQLHLASGGHAGQDSSSSNKMLEAFPHVPCSSELTVLIFWDSAQMPLPTSQAMLSTESYSINCWASRHPTSQTPLNSSVHVCLQCSSTSYPRTKAYRIYSPSYAEHPAKCLCTAAIKSSLN